MRLFGEALLMTFTEVAPEYDADFSEWYNREHLDERINLPGFRRARRYQAVSAPIRYLSMYEAISIGDIASPRYLELLGKQTEWSQRVIKRFVKWQRVAGKVMVDAAHGIGGFMAIARLPVDASRAEALRGWLATDVFPSLIRAPSVIGAFAVMADTEADDRLTRGLGQIPMPGRIPEWVILVEGTDLGAVRVAVEKWLTPGLERFVSGSGGTVMVHTYQILSVNQRLGEDALA
jgi:hypothetical protein